MQGFVWISAKMVCIYIYIYDFSNTVGVFGQKSVCLGMPNPHFEFCWTCAPKRRPCTPKQKFWDVTNQSRSPAAAQSCHHARSRELRVLILSSIWVSICVLHPCNGYWSVAAETLGITTKFLSINWDGLSIQAHARGGYFVRRGVLLPSTIQVIFLFTCQFLRPCSCKRCAFTCIHCSPRYLLLKSLFVHV